MLPSGFTRNTVLLVPASPCEHPAPASIPYSVSPMNATSATPLTSPPDKGLVWLDGKCSTTGVTTPAALIFEMREVKAPVYGPMGNPT